eukprot:gene13568-6547_t
MIPLLLFIAIAQPYGAGALDYSWAGKLDGSVAAYKVARMRRVTAADNITHGGAVDGDEVQDDNDEPENLNTTQPANTTTYAPIIKFLSVTMLFKEVDLDAIENLGQLQNDDIFNITLSAGSVVADVVVSTYDAKEAVDTLLNEGVIAFEYGDQILTAETASTTTSSTTRTNTTTTVTHTTTLRPTAAPVSPFAGNIADLTEVKLYLAAGIAGPTSDVPTDSSGNVSGRRSRTNIKPGLSFTAKKRTDYGTSGGGGGGSAGTSVGRSKSVSFHHGHRASTLTSNKSLPAE